MISRRTALLALAPPLVDRLGLPTDEPAPPPIDPEPMLFRIGNVHYWVDPVERTMDVADRRDLFGHLPQPEPVGRIDVGRGLTVLIWDQDPRESCARCSRSCRAGWTNAGDWRCGVGLGMD